MRKAHITNGQSYNNDFEKRYHQKGIPFCEAMMEGKAEADIFSDKFFATRACELGVSEKEYRENLKAFCDFLKDLSYYNEIHLWFGADTFCQMNLLTILAYLEHAGYSGSVYFNLIDDVSGEQIHPRKAVELKGYYELYHKILVEHVFAVCSDEVMRKAIELYFDYLSPDGQLSRIIKNNPEVSENDLIRILLSVSEEYGLGDTQAAKLISRCRQ